MALVLAGSFMYGLQQLLFGPLRPLETEQLWEKGWFAMMEWVFAMSTFRDEFGVWFLVMFMSLFTGKIWGWIAEGRVEHLEQQAPNDPRLFHGRLMASLAIYIFFAVQMFMYSFDIVSLEARPGMTIMFVFEFAILCIAAMTTCLRYVIWVQEHRITKQQVSQAVEARKAEIRKQRQEAEEKLKADPEAEDAPDMAALPKEEDVDEQEIEAPGWEAKRGWLFALDIISGMCRTLNGTSAATNFPLDLLKLVAYMAFFTILTVFYGIPIYIIRDLYMTMRSFVKRVSDYLRFQAATRDMDTRYPNATAQDLATDNTCIVCREEMRPVDGPAPAGAFGQAMHQRQKPKKLPCGHILHFGCLSSWLERQQACPICRRSVFLPAPPTTGQAAAQAGQAPAAGAHNQNQNPQQRPQRNEGRVFRLGPLRIQLGGQIGRPNDQELLNALGRLAQNHRQNVQRNRENLINSAANGTPAAAATSTAAGAVPQADASTTSVADPANSDIHPGIRSAAARMALNTIEQQIQREIQALNIQGQRANTIRNLQNELDRTRNIPQPPPRQQQRAAVTPGSLPLTSGAFPASLPPLSRPDVVLNHNQQTFPFGRATDTTHVTPPPGVVVPQGWTLVPLNPITDQSDVAQAPAQMLQTFLNHNASGNAPIRTSTMINNQLSNPLAQFLAGAMTNGAPTVRSGSQPPAISSSRIQGPFPPPPIAPAASTTAGVNSTMPPSPPTNGDHHAPSEPNSHPLHSPSPQSHPTAPTPTWNFPPATSSSSEESQPTHSGKGKAPALSVPETDGSTSPSVPQTHVEPPTPVDGEGGMQASVEDGGEGEE